MGPRVRPRERLLVRFGAGRSPIPGARLATRRCHGAHRGGRAEAHGGCSIAGSIRRAHGGIYGIGWRSRGASCGRLCRRTPLGSPRRPGMPRGRQGLRLPQAGRRQGISRGAGRGGVSERVTTRPAEGQAPRLLGRGPPFWLQGPHAGVRGVYRGGRPGLRVAAPRTVRADDAGQVAALRGGREKAR